jgi:hypothetical protein
VAKPPWPVWPAGQAMKMRYLLNIPLQAPNSCKYLLNIPLRAPNLSSLASPLVSDLDSVSNSIVVHYRI